MASSTPLLLLCLLLTTTSATITSPEDKLTLSTTSATVHDILQKYGLPRGLLPDSVKSYTFNDNDGDFKVTLEAPCYVQFDSLIYYETTITGNLRFGSIKEISGIQAQKFFLWVDVSSIEADFANKVIEIHVGLFSEELPMKMFEDIPTCKDKAVASASLPCRGMGLFPLPFVSEE